MALITIKAEHLNNIIKKGNDTFILSDELSQIELYWIKLHVGESFFNIISDESLLMKEYRKQAKNYVKGK